MYVCRFPSCFVYIAVLSAFAPLSQRAAASDVLKDEVQPLLTKYCSDCHAAGTDTGFKIDMLADPQRVRIDRRLIAKVLEKLRTDKMPPKDAAQPSADDRRRLLDSIELAARPDPSAPSAVLDPGHVVMRRLSRYEYAKTVRDLFSLGGKTTWTYSAPPGAEFPEQGVEYKTRTYKLPWNLPPDEVDYGFDNIGEVLTLSPYLMESYFEVAGLVVDRVMADQAPDRSSGEKKVRPKSLPIRPGPDKTEQEAARANLASLAERAFRRPVAAEEVERLVELFTLARGKESSFDEAMKIPLRALLVSPDFLFHVERGVAAADRGEVRPLNDYELASRLSYFVWSSLPDAELFRLAREQKLSDPAVLEQQVRRMLVDPKAEALAEHFAPQWLQIEDIQAAMPDPALYAPFYRGFLGGAMRTEAIMFFDALLVQDRSVLDLIDSDTTILNARLAEYYGLIAKAPNGYDGFAWWREYKLPPGRRAGVLTMAAVATVTSTPTRSSPVKRGKWVLEAILGDPPPPPPPNVEEIKEDAAGEAPLSFREKLERHRSHANCAACHQAMDPLGFALENLDAIGRWRERAGSEPIDATGTLKDGTMLAGAEGLKAEILNHRRDDFTRCFTEHLLTYALGRKLQWYDGPAVEKIVAALSADDYRFSTLMVGIATSHPFRNLRHNDAQ